MTERGAAKMVRNFPIQDTRTIWPGCLLSSQYNDVTDGLGSDLVADVRIDGDLCHRVLRAYGCKEDFVSDGLEG